MLLTSALEVNWWPVAVLMLFSSLLAVVYIWRVVEVLYFSEPSAKAKSATEAPMLMLVPTYVVLGATIVFGCWTVYSAGLANKAATSLLGIIEAGGTP
jgi:multicomponent Na+:H+ antiporter subunit D